ncbi:MAG: roadblock/LC7 domain-containing protein [Candidatus Saliniplasma sp.]
MTANTIEEVLSSIKKNLDVEEVTLISRSGMHIGGDVPENAHLETFVAMSAILLGAAETATSELDEELSHVVVELKNSRVLVMNDGPSALLAIKMSQESDIDEVLKGVEQPMEELKELL